MIRFNLNPKVSCNLLLNSAQDINQITEKPITYVESSQFLSTKTTASADGDHVTDGGPDIFPHSHNYHVPLFTLSVSIVEVSLTGQMSITKFFFNIVSFEV